MREYKWLTHKKLFFGSFNNTPKADIFSKNYQTTITDIFWVFPFQKFYLLAIKINGQSTFTVIIYYYRFHFIVINVEIFSLSFKFGHLPKIIKFHHLGEASES